MNFQNLEITCHFGLPPIFKELGPVCRLSLHYLVPRLSPGEHEAAGGTHTARQIRGNFKRKRAYTKERARKARCNERTNQLKNWSISHFRNVKQMDRSRPAVNCGTDVGILLPLRETHD